MNKNKHIFGNNISNSDKIMINSPKVYFSITWQLPEVGLKNNYILRYKNDLGRSISQDNLYKKIPSVTMYKFLHKT
jgi:hypothetical protein